MAVHQHLPMDRMAQFFSDVLGAPVSVGSLANMVAEAADATGPFLEATRQLLRDAPVVHFDETGGRATGRLHWVHSASTGRLTLRDCHPKRGRLAMDDLGVIGEMSGVAVHDGWRPYRHYGIDHALCNAHHLRELTAVAIGWDQGWANDPAGLLVEAKHAIEAARAEGSDHLDAATLHSIRVHYGQLVAKGFAANPEPEVGKRRGKEKAFNLLVHLDTPRADVLRFVTDFNVPFDNNQAERDIRMVKLQQKTSGSWRTLAGARNFCAIRSYVSTLRKHDLDVLAGLRQLFKGQAWVPAGACTVARPHCAQGCDVVTVQRALGHAPANTTLSTRAHLWPDAEDRTRGAAEAMLNEALGSGTGNLAGSVRTTGSP
jgi:transposase